MKMVEGSEARHRRLAFHREGEGDRGGAGTSRVEGGGKGKSYNFIGQKDTPSVLREWKQKLVYKNETMLAYYHKCVL